MVVGDILRVAIAAAIAGVIAGVIECDTRSLAFSSTTGFRGKQCTGGVF